MGRWCKNTFGQETCGTIGVIVAGTSSPTFEQEVLNLFDEIISSQDSVYHAHLVKNKGITYSLVFNVYGAPAMVDVLTEMHDGGCRTVLFVGVAYGGFKNLEVGTIVIPTKAYHFDGIYHALKLDKEETFPDPELQQKLENVFKQNGISYEHGVNISVPAVTFQLAHANDTYQKIQPTTVEMELASCLSRGRDIGMRAVGTLIISDNRRSGLDNAAKKEVRHAAKLRVLKTIIDTLPSFDLSSLPVKHKFTIDEHLASIIHDPDDETNVYRR